ncbi:hypothetical protein BHM03_00060091 [Ensete ventricosum]|nr:hypothetical protein BHM03_00060091 [Ensete ventricosum]
MTPQGRSPQDCFGKFGTTPRHTVPHRSIGCLYEIRKPPQPEKPGAAPHNTVPRGSIRCSYENVQTTSPRKPGATPHKTVLRGSIRCLYEMCKPPHPGKPRVAPHNTVPRGSIKRRYEMCRLPHSEKTGVVSYNTDLCMSIGIRTRHTTKLPEVTEDSAGASPYFHANHLERERLHLIHLQHQLRSTWLPYESGFEPSHAEDSATA